MARTKEPPEPVLYRARSSGRVRIKGILHAYSAGRTILPGDHPLVRHLPGRFLPIRLSGMQVETEPAPIVAEAVVTEPEIVVEDEAVAEGKSAWRTGRSR